MRKLPLLLLFSLILIQSVAATEYTTMSNLITFKNPLGLLIPLGIETFLPVEEAIMYYNYIAIFLIVAVAGFAGQVNESRFTFFVPIFAGLMVFIGWLQAPDPVTYYGMIIGCIMLGAIMYINDMNHEKYGLPGPGTKLLTVVFMIIVFEASVTIMSTNGLNIFPELGNAGLSQRDVSCNSYGYTCDANGNIMLSASVTTLNNIGNNNDSLASIVSWAIQSMIAAFVFFIKILAAVALFSVVLYAAYPALQASPQAVVMLVAIQLVIWSIYAVYIFNILYKPSYETSQV